MNIKLLAKNYMNKILAKKGLEIRSKLGYISAKETVAAAKKESLSVCEYVEKIWNQQGDSQAVIDRIDSFGVFLRDNPNILEIGAGTGRYLEKVLHRCNPAKYESYETASDWADWLASEYPIISHKADGLSLQQTQSQSIDILHAHGVFVYLPFLICYRYFKEIFRVMKINGSVVFDIISEDCLDQSTVENWINSKHAYPCFLAVNYVISLFEKNGFHLLGTFLNRYGAGKSKYLVFKRNKFDSKGARPDPQP